MARCKIIEGEGYKLSEPVFIAPYNNFGLQILIMEDTEESTIKELDKLFPEAEFDGDEYAMVHRYYDKSKYVLVTFNIASKHGTPISANCISHECIHIKNILFESIGHKNSVKMRTDEPEAYLVGYLTEIIFDFFVRTGHLDKIKFEYNEQHY